VVEEDPESYHSRPQIPTLFLGHTPRHDRRSPDHHAVVGGAGNPGSPAPGFVPARIAETGGDRLRLAVSFRADSRHELVYDSIIFLFIIFNFIYFYDGNI
jgi:hypothetical protein